LYSRRPSSVNVNVAGVEGSVGNDFVSPNCVVLASSSGSVCFRILTVAHWLGAAGAKHERLHVHYLPYHHVRRFGVRQVAGAWESSSAGR
jgi:hypothetical protein